ncbi:MAG: hypothetical protein U0U25_00025 [Flavobacteriales bacterium]
MGRTKEIRTKAEELLSFGIPKQQVFDHLLLEFPEAKPKKVAEVVRYLPSLQARERYGSVHRGLLITIALSAVLRVAHPLLDPHYDWASGLKYVSLIPIATLLVGWTIYRWQGQVFAWVGWGNVASAGSLIKQGGKLFSGEADPWNIAFAAFPVLIGLLALVLAYGVFAGYKRETDPLTGVERVVFREEPAL